MGLNTKIPWTTHTWNPWQGCRKVSAGCQNCYMFRDKTRYGQDPTIIVRSSLATFRKPLSIKERAFVFACSWSDFFLEEADAWRDEVWAIIRQTPHLVYQILTKRPENIAARLPKDWGNGWPHVWFGVTTENQQMLDKRIPEVLGALQGRAALLWYCAEPLLGPLDFGEWLDPDPPHRADRHRERTGHEAVVVSGEKGREAGQELWCRECDLRWRHDDIGWGIVGAESGPRARAMSLEWVRCLRDQHLHTGIPFFFKQARLKGRMDHAPELDGRRLQEVPPVPGAAERTLFDFLPGGH